MIASLPMYDRPETAAVYDHLWHGMRAALGYGPKALTRSDDLWSAWQSPDLLFGQACSLPFRMGLRDRVDIVASAVHPLPVAAGHYCSRYVVRTEETRAKMSDFVGARAAVNGRDSHSGFVALPEDLRATMFETGSHAASARAIAEDRADIAAIDAVTWEMILRWDACAGRLRVIGTSAASPAPPFITAKGNDVSALFAALKSAVAMLLPEERLIIGVQDVVRLPDAAYLGLPVPATTA